MDTINVSRGISMRLDTSVIADHRGPNSKLFALSSVLSLQLISHVACLRHASGLPTQNAVQQYA